MWLTNLTWAEPLVSAFMIENLLLEIYSIPVILSGDSQVNWRAQREEKVIQDLKAPAQETSTLLQHRSKVSEGRDAVSS